MIQRRSNDLQIVPLVGLKLAHLAQESLPKPEASGLLGGATVALTLFSLGRDIDAH